MPHVMSLFVVAVAVVRPALSPFLHHSAVDVISLLQFPAAPPEMKLLTTGSGSIRFNPNLYNNGRVCLSLLGTWEGDSTQTWNASRCSLLQLFTSVQTIILSERPYFNEPGTEGLEGTKQGLLLNQGYTNIARYATVKYAITGQLTNPPDALCGIIRYVGSYFMRLK